MAADMLRICVIVFMLYNYILGVTCNKRVAKESTRREGRLGIYSQENVQI